MSTASSFRREEYVKRRRTLKWIRFSVISFCILLVCTLLVYISYRPSLRISEVTLSGQVLVTGGEVKNETLNFLRGKYLWLLPKNSAFLYQRRALEVYLKEHFKRIDTIHISLTNYHTLSVNISERKPFAIWCDMLPSQFTGGAPTTTHSATTLASSTLEESPVDTRESVVESTESHCYFMDSNSTIFAEAPQFSGDAYFKYFGLLDTNILSPIGHEYIKNTEDFSHMDTFVRVAQSLGIRPQYLVAKENGEYSLVLFGGGSIYFDTREPLEKTGDNLRTLLQSPVFATTTKYGLPVEYIDLRFGNKLFYKLK